MYAYVRDMTFEEFLDIRVLLHLDDVNIMELSRKIKELFKKFEFNHGITPDEYLTLCPHSDDRKEIFELLIPFFYLDYNESGTLEVDELLFGYILMTPAT
jgi:hypothetical protein